jgi:hypothetical protein
MAIGTLKTTCDLPDITEMVDALLEDNSQRSAASMVDSITERIFEDWECKVNHSAVRDFVLIEAKRITAERKKRK